MYCLYFLGPHLKIYVKVCINTLSVIIFAFPTAAEGSTQRNKSASKTCGRRGEGDGLLNDKT